MAEPKGLVYSGQDDTGYATILGNQPSPFTIAAPIINKALDEQFNQIKEQRERKKQIDDNFAKLNEYVPVWDYTKEEIASDINNLQDAFVTIRSQGGDPYDPAQPYAKDYLGADRNVRMKIEMDKANKQAFDEIVATYQKDPTKYDEQQFSAFLDGIQKQNTVSGINDYINRSKPLVPKIDFTAGMNDFEPGGSATPWRDVLPRDKSDQAARNYIAVRETQNPGFLDAGIAKGLWKDEEDAVRFYSDEYQNRYKAQTKAGPSGGDKGGLSFSAGTGQVNGFTLAGNSRWATSGGKMDEVSIAYKGKDVPAFEVEESVDGVTTGRTLFMSPNKVFRDENGKLKIAGIVYERKGDAIPKQEKTFAGESMEELAAAQEKQKEELLKNAPAGSIIQEDGDYFIVFTPTVEKEVDYDVNDIRFRSHVGTSIYEFEKEWNKKAGKSSPTKQTSFVGVPEGGF